MHILQQLQVGWFNFLLMMTEEVANTPKKHIYIGFRYVYHAFVYNYAFLSRGIKDDICYSPNKKIKISFLALKALEDWLSMFVI